jgi:hypothetical protein
MSPNWNNINNFINTYVESQKTSSETLTITEDKLLKQILKHKHVIPSETVQWMLLFVIAHSEHRIEIITTLLKEAIQRNSIHLIRLALSVLVRNRCLNREEIESILTPLLTKEDWIVEWSFVNNSHNNNVKEQKGSAALSPLPLVQEGTWFPLEDEPSSPYLASIWRSHIPPSLSNADAAQSSIVSSFFTPLTMTTTIPIDVWISILKFCNASTFLAVRLTCRDACRASLTIQSGWKAVLLARWPDVKFDTGIKDARERMLSRIEQEKRRTTIDPLFFCVRCDKSFTSRTKWSNHCC